MPKVRRGVTLTDGRRFLVRWLDADSSHTQTWIAERVERSQVAVSHWVKGIARPEPPLRAVLEVLIGCPEGSWETADEKRERERVMKSALAAPAAESSHRVADIGRARKRSA